VSEALRGYVRMRTVYTDKPTLVGVGLLPCHVDRKRLVALGEANRSNSEMAGIAWSYGAYPTFIAVTRECAL